MRQVFINGKEVKVYEQGKYYAYGEILSNNVISWYIYKDFNEKSFARIDYLKDTKTLIILLFRKDTSKKFLKYMLSVISTALQNEIKEIIYQDKCFNDINDIFKRGE